MKKDQILCINCFPDDIDSLPVSNNYEEYCNECWSLWFKRKHSLLNAERERKILAKVKDTRRKDIMSERHREDMEGYFKKALRCEELLFKRRVSAKEKLKSLTKGIVN